MTDSANEKLQQSCDELAAGILAVCETCGAKIACTESLTGGLLSDAFVRIPGASNVLLGFTVTYDIKAKASILHVDRLLLEREGACTSRSRASDGGWHCAVVCAAGIR